MPRQDPGIEVPQVKSCLFCWSLEMGSKIIAWLTTIGGLLEAVATGEILYRVLKAKYEFLDFFQVGIEFAISFGTFLFGIYLLKGIFEKNVTYVKQWVVWTTVEIILIAIVIILELASPPRFYYYYTYYHNSKIGGEIVHLCVCIYFLMVVFSYYKEQWPNASRNLFSLK